LITLVVGTGSISVAQLTSAWDPAPLVLGMAFVALLRFAQAFVRLRRRGRHDHAGWDRAALFVGGLALVTLPLVSPLDAAGDNYLLSAHMLQHVLIGDAGPALLVVAVRGPLLSFMLPVFIVRWVLRLGPLHRLFGALTRPSVSLAAWSAAIAAWHIPAVYDYALGHQAVHDLEHLSFVTVGLLAWTALVDPMRRRRLPVGQRLAFAGALFLLGQLLADVLFFASDPLYPAYAAQPARLFGISALADEQFASLVMMGEQLVTLGAFTALLLVSSVRRLERPQDRVVPA
jgi:cytochrome c oxidase assembly factor CtaG